MSSLKIQTSEIKEIHDNLVNCWNLSKESWWRDSDCLRFEQQHWLPLEKELRNTIKEMEFLAKIIEDAKRHTQCNMR